MRLIFINDSLLDTDEEEEDLYSPINAYEAWRYLRWVITNIVKVSDSDLLSTRQVFFFLFQVK
jgi:hypothetical protein